MEVTPQQPVHSTPHLKVGNACGKTSPESTPCLWGILLYFQTPSTTLQSEAAARVPVFSPFSPQLSGLRLFPPPFCRPAVFLQRSRVAVVSLVSCSPVATSCRQLLPPLASPCRVACPLTGLRRLVSSFRIAKLASSQPSRNGLGKKRFNFFLSQNERRL